jgi:hypothetical protein
MCAKFRSLAGAVISRERCDEIIAAVSKANPADLAVLCSQQELTHPPEKRVAVR